MYIRQLQDYDIESIINNTEDVLEASTTAFAAIANSFDKDKAREKLNNLYESDVLKGIVLATEDNELVGCLLYVVQPHWILDATVLAELVLWVREDYRSKDNTDYLVMALEIYEDPDMFMLGNSLGTYKSDRAYVDNGFVKSGTLYMKGREHV